MAQHVQLRAEPRELLGKKVRRLRRAGILPATVYGYNTQPQSIQVNAHEVATVLRQAGRTQLIDLLLGGERARPVFIKQTTVDAKRNQILHIEFYQANLTELMTNRIPLHFVGESQAVRDGGILLTLLDHIDIESLPDNVPAGGLDVDIASLAEINAQIHAGELPLPDGVTLITPPDEVVAKVNPPVSEETLEQAVADTEPLPAELGGDTTPADAVPES